MATYPTIHDILNEKVPGASSMTLPELVENGREVIFNFNYPIVTTPQYAAEDYKKYFETEFIIKYMTREISRSDFDLWELKLYGVLNNIMPYYNQYIESEQWFSKYIDNPANNTDYKETYSRTIDSTNSTTSGGKLSQTTTANGTTSTNGSTTDDNVTESTSKSTNTADTSSTSTQNQEGTNENGTTNSQFPQSEYDELTDFATDRSVATAKTTANSSTDSSGSTESSTKTTQNDKSKNTSTTNSTDSTNTSSSTSSKTSATQDDESNSKETYEFHRVGNIGVQTPGEVFASTRKAFINTLQDILNDKSIRELFLQVGGDFDDLFEF